MEQEEDSGGGEEDRSDEGKKYGARRNVNGQWLCLGLEREREEGENGSVREIRRPIGSE